MKSIPHVVEVRCTDGSWEVQHCTCKRAAIALGSRLRKSGVVAYVFEERSPWRPSLQGAQS